MSSSLYISEPKPLLVRNALFLLCTFLCFSCVSDQTDDRAEWLESAPPIYYDLAEAVAKAKPNQPILLQFGGWACVGDRKMERFLEEDPEVVAARSAFSYAHVMVDDKEPLPDGLGDYYLGALDSLWGKRRLRTIGDKWGVLESAVFGQSSQPYLVALSQDGCLLTKPIGYERDAKVIIDFLDRSLQAHKEDVCFEDVSAIKIWMQAPSDSIRAAHHRTEALANPIPRVVDGKPRLTCDGEGTASLSGTTEAIVSNWCGDIQPMSGGQYMLTLTADIGENWKVFSSHLASNEGPIPLALFEEENLSLKGEPIPSDTTGGYDLAFEMKLHYWEQKVSLSQVISFPVEGQEASFTVEYMTCDDARCLPPYAFEMGIVWDAENDESGRGVRMVPAN